MKKIPLIEQLKKLHPKMSKKELFSKVLCGEVFVGDEKILDPKYRVRSDSEPSFFRDPYVGRGGLKLEHAISRWKISVEGRVFLDAGASTGGFTDCLLQHGARLVHAVDVGYNQLAYALRRDTRVRAIERTNIMHVTELEPPADCAVADLSFRSLRGAAAHILSLTGDRILIALLKPQFEYRSQDFPERKPEDFAGIIDEPEIAERVIKRVLEDLTVEGVKVEDIIPSPIRGRSGNREFLLLLSTREVNRDAANEEGGAFGWEEALRSALSEAYSSGPIGKDLPS